MIDVDELLPYIQYSWDVADESIVISLTVDVDLEPVTASVQLDNETAEGKKVTMKGDDAAINVTKGAIVTLTPEEGYRITDVTSATGNINWGLNLDGTVTVAVKPSATNVYLNVKVDAIEYTLNVTNNVKADVKGVTDGQDVTVEDKIEFTVTAANASDKELTISANSGDLKVNQVTKGNAAVRSDVYECKTWDEAISVLNLAKTYMADGGDGKLYYNTSDQEVVDFAGVKWEDGVKVYFYKEAPVVETLECTLTGVTSDVIITVDEK